MVKRSELIYRFLRLEKKDDGHSVKEIMDNFSERYGITPGKGLKRQIRSTLKKGVDFGVVTRRYNRFRLDIDSWTSPVTIKKEKPTTIRQKRVTKRPKSSSSSSSSSPKSRRKTRSSGKSSSSNPIPIPHLPPPPDWTTKPRNLREEPLQKFIKHSENPFY